MDVARRKIIEHRYDLLDLTEWEFNVLATALSRAISRRILRQDEMDTAKKLGDKVDDAMGEE